ncbi:MAG: TlpA family protein disulfide reductase [Clostridia bacterium]|nr:TlpA family protein disulfide reductase [Clostridia bacterium]
MKRAFFALLAGIALLLTACGQAPAPAAPAEPAETAGDTNPVESGILSAFTTRDLEGNILDQDILKGKKLTVVNVWATFCGPCLRELPELEKLSREMEGKGVQIIGIAADVTDWNGQVRGELLELAKEIVSQTGVSFPSLIPCRDLAALSGVQSFPTTIFVDENGCQIGGAYVGARDLAQWRYLVEAALEKLS